MSLQFTSMCPGLFGVFLTNFRLVNVTEHFNLNGKSREGRARCCVTNVRLTQKAEKRHA